MHVGMQLQTAPAHTDRQPTNFDFREPRKQVDGQQRGEEEKEGNHDAMPR